MMAKRRPTALAAELIRWMRSAWPVRSPCEKLSRATFRPARMRRSSISDDSDAGPIVATILVLFSGSAIRAFSLATLAVIANNRPPAMGFHPAWRASHPFESRVHIKNDAPFALTPDAVGRHGQH